MKENWLTRRPRWDSSFVTLALTLVVVGLSFIYLRNLFEARTLLSANPDQVFQHGEYWRLWSSILIHANPGHLLSNLILFIPLAFLLTNYFGFLFFPVVGLISGGGISALVLMTMPENVSLVGISGVVSWMVGAWLTLFFLIDQRKSLKHRFALAVFLTLFLMVPESYKPEVSYLSHFVGFLFGILSALVLYFIQYQKIQNAAVWIREDVPIPEDGGPSHS